MEEHGCDDEEAKDTNLAEETGDDDLFTNFVEVQCSSRLDTSTACLEREGNDISSDKDSCNPVYWDQRQTLSSEGANQTTQNHVNRGGVEGGSDEDQNGLNDEPANREGIIMTPYSTAVTDGLNLKRMSVFPNQLVQIS